MPKFKVTVDTGYPGADHFDEFSIPDDEWSEMTEEEQEKAKSDAMSASVWNFIDVWCEEVVDGEAAEDGADPAP